MPAAGVMMRLAEMAGELTVAESRVSEYLTTHVANAGAMSITELAQRSGASEATIVRLCKKLRLRGYHDLRLSLARDAGDTRLKVIHEDIELGDGPDALLKKVFTGAHQALDETFNVLDPANFAETVNVLENANSINFFGIGSSGLVAQNAQFRFMKLGIHCYALTDNSRQISRIATIGAGDVVVTISHSGKSQNMIHLVEQARARGAFTIAITQFGRQPLIHACDISLLTSSRETAFKSEAMASRIAQHALLDALFVGVALTRYETVASNVRTEHALNNQIQGIPTKVRSPRATNTNTNHDDRRL